MKLPRVLAVLMGIALLIAALGCSTNAPAVLMGIALLIAALGCSTNAPVEVVPTPNIDATIETRVNQNNGNGT